MDQCSAADARKVQIVAGQPGLHGFAGQLGGMVSNTRNTPAMETSSAWNSWQNTRAPASPWAPAIARPRSDAVDVHATVGHHLRAGADCRGDDEVAVTSVDALAGAHGLVMHQRG